MWRVFYFNDFQRRQAKSESKKSNNKNNSVELSRHGSIKNVTCIEYANAKIYRISRMCIDYEQIQRMNEQKKKFDRIKRMSEMSDTWIEFLCFS